MNLVVKKAVNGRTGWLTAAFGIPMSVLLTTLYTAGVKSERLDNVCIKLNKVEVKVEQALKDSQESKLMFTVIREDIGDIKKALEKIKNAN